MSHAASVIETPRLVLRLPRPGDAESLLEFVGDEEVMRPIGDEAGGLGRVGLIVWNRRTWETSSSVRAGASGSRRRPARTDVWAYLR